MTSLRDARAAPDWKGDGYFYFSGGEASDWLDKTVNASSLSSLSLEHWMAEFERLTELKGTF